MHTLGVGALMWVMVAQVGLVRPVPEAALAPGKCLCTAARRQMRRRAACVVGSAQAVLSDVGQRSHAQVQKWRDASPQTAAAERHSSGQVLAVQTSSAVLAGCTSAALTNGLDVIKTRIQVAPQAHHPAFPHQICGCPKRQVLLAYVS